MAEGDIASLGLKIDSSEVKKADEALDKLAKSAGKADAATGDLKGTWDQYSGALNRGIGLLSIAARALPAIAVGAALKSMAAEGIRFGDQIAKAARAAGIAAGEFSQYAAVAQSIGAEIPTLSTAFEILGRKISQSAAGNKEATRALTQLGLSAEFLRRLKPGEQLEQVADALLRLQNQSDRNALGNEVLGSSFEQLAPALAEGANGLRRLREEQERLGNTLTTEQIKKLEEAQQSVRALSAAWANFGRTLAVTVAPPLTVILTKLSQVVSPQQSLDSLRAQLKSIENGYDEVAKAKLRAEIASLEGRGGTGRGGGGRGLGGALDPALIAEISRELDKGTAAADRMAASAAKAMRNASLSFDLGAIKRNLTLAASEYANYEDLLDAERRAGLISEREYYAEKRALIEQSAAAQIAALEAESKRLKADRLAGPELLEQQRKIADNEAEIAIIREKAATQVSVLSTQQKAALSDVARAYEDARASAERYLDVLRERYRIEIEGMGQGRDARERAQGRNSLDREYTDRINDLRRDRRKASDEDQRAQIDKEIAIQEDAHQRALQDFDDYYDQLKEKQGSFYTGAMEALQNYVDESANVAAQTESAFSRAFGSMEDALTRFVMTGKLDFKSLADSIIADLIRIQMRAALSQLFSLIGGAIAGAGAGKLSGTSGVGTLNTSTVGFAAKGGDISGPTIVGEEGPELIVPRNPMTVIPNHQLGGGVTIHTTINAAPGMNVAQMTALLDARDAQVKADVYQNMGRNRWRRVTG